MELFIEERYKIENGAGAVLGEGGMGKVYRGVDMETGQTVAIKVLNRDIVQLSPDIVERFEREAEALQRFNHPNIVNVLASVEQGEDHYLVMEYVGGGSLRDLLRKTPTVPLETCLKLAVEIASALSQAHQYNIIHRDIKPANVLLTKKGSARLTDFGVARINDRSRLTKSGMIVGTIGYLSPEALGGGQIDHRSDIWAFGVMLYEMLAGQHPFEADDKTNVVTSIVAHHPDPLDKFRQNIPVELQKLVEQMLQKDLDNRIDDMRLVVRELERIRLGLDASHMEVDSTLHRRLYEEGDLEPVRDLISKGEKGQARMLLRPLLKSQPTAELWYLAAQTMPRSDQAVRCLKKAIALDAWHLEANRMLHRLEGTKSLNERPQAEGQPQKHRTPAPPVAQRTPPESTPAPAVSDGDTGDKRRAEYQKRQSRRLQQRRLGCLGGVVIFALTFVFILSMLGLIPGVVGRVSALVIGVEPVYEVGGVPLENVSQAVLKLEPAMVRDVEGATLGLVDHGLLHEYRYRPAGNDYYTIYVRFFSVNAANVRQNVAVIDPDGNDRTSICQRGQIEASFLDGLNSAGYICRMDQMGDWRIRVLGVEGESVGVYVVSVNPYEP